MNCCIPKQDHSNIQSAHGGGGKMTQKLLESVFFPVFNNEILAQEHDSAQIWVPEGKIAFTTDSFVVTPLFFADGNIGDLAVNGTVNDLLCSGATPKYISAGFIIEEGFSIDKLKIIVQSMSKAAKKANVKIVTGDTKVIDRTDGNQIYINTSGIGIIPKGVEISPSKVRENDVVIVSGRIGEHGTSIMSKRNDLGFDTEVKSDTASLNNIVENLIKYVPQINMLRDPTRGGLSSTLNEIADSANVSIELNECDLPISKGVIAACELLGMDPLYIANEGLLIVIVPQDCADLALYTIKNSEHGENAAIIGKVTKRDDFGVYLNSDFGTKRVVEMISGEQLPRIC